MNKKNIEKEAPKYTSRLIVRLTPQLHKEIAEYAALCGLTTSAYARKRLEGKYPKQRLTDKEMEALNSLSDARGDIQKLFGFLKGEEIKLRLRHFRQGPGHAAGRRRRSRPSRAGA